jgi:hypothetical protein
VKEPLIFTASFLPFAFCLTGGAFSANLYFSETDRPPPRIWQVDWLGLHIFVTISGQFGILYIEQEIIRAK